MPVIIGALRIKNEARWISEVLDSISFCDRILVMDDHSTDGTPGICREAGAAVFDSPFGSFDEARDKDWLLAKVLQCAGKYSADHWCLWIDGDEVLEPDGPRIIRKAVAGLPVAYTLRVVYLWDRRDQMRVDGVYGNFRRPSLFSLSSPDLSFARTGRGNLHCSSVPKQFWGRSQHCEARLFHLGYMHREDRKRKFDWYREIDPGNQRQDEYRHIVQGDIPEVPAGKKLSHIAGPLELAPL